MNFFRWFPERLTRLRLKRLIIVWLGGAYSGDYEYGSNPDYYSSREVDELVDRIMGEKPKKNDTASPSSIGQRLNSSNL